MFEEKELLYRDI